MLIDAKEYLYLEDTDILIGAVSRKVRYTLCRGRVEKAINTNVSQMKKPCLCSTCSAVFDIDQKGGFSVETEVNAGVLHRPFCQKCKGD